MHNSVINIFTLAETCVQLVCVIETIGGRVHPFTLGQANSIKIQKNEFIHYKYNR